MNQHLQELVSSVADFTASDSMAAPSPFAALVSPLPPTLVLGTGAPVSASAEPVLRFVPAAGPVAGLPALAAKAVTVSKGFVLTYWRVLVGVAVLAGAVYFFTARKGKNGYKRP